MKKTVDFLKNFCYNIYIYNKGKVIKMSKETTIANLQTRIKLLESRGPHNIAIVNHLKRRLKHLIAE